VTHRPRKRFGQHFLHDPGVIARIVAAIDPVPGDTLLEIGPGRGAITRPLLERAGRLHVVEIDRDLAMALRAGVGVPGELIVHEQDALTLDLSELAPAGDRLRVVGNLPYNVSTPLLFHLLAQRASIRDMHFMLQKEVVDRIVAPPGGRDYGRLSVMVAWHCEAERLFDVGAGAFTPPPRVRSAVLRLLPRRVPLVTGIDEALLGRLVTAAFSRRRKTLRNALATLLTAERIEAAGIDPGRRPETLTPAEFARLAAAAG
jgi:16S rRNA (adenine1518-N6/adenine1519-N6)-dimethyltransferase